MYKDKDNILIDFYDGAYGPTIRIEIHSRKMLEEIRDLFRQLADAKLNIVHLVKHPSVKSNSSVEITLNLVSSNKEQRRTLEIVSSSLDEKGFQWSMGQESWLDCVERVQTLIENDSPGHQYLSNEGVDDALVELSYKEET